MEKRSCRWQYKHFKRPVWMHYFAPLLVIQMLKWLEIGNAFLPTTTLSTRNRPYSTGCNNIRATFISSPKQNCLPFTARQFHLDCIWTDYIESGHSYCLNIYFYLPTQPAITGTFCANIGDVIAQNDEIKKEQPSSHNLNENSSLASAGLRYDPIRSFHDFLKGIGGGIIWACWFDTSEFLSISLTHSILQGPLYVMESEHVSTTSLSKNIIPLPTVEELITRTIISILLEQFLVSPMLFTFWDIPLPALLRGTPWYQIPTQIQKKLIPLLVANAKVWTLVNAVTYNIPLEYRVLFCQLCRYSLAKY